MAEMTLETAEPTHAPRPSSPSGASTMPSPAQEAPDRSAPEAFEFTGSGSEYFRIWVVNLLLTVATLGIYSAWAKARRLQYFYRNTRLASASFDFLGTPKAILKGRMLAFGLFAGYNIAANISLAAGAVIGLALMAMIPWLLSRSLRFKLANSAYRNVRFHFAGSVGQAYRMFILFPVVFMLTGLLIWSVSVSFWKSAGFLLPLVLAALATVVLTGAVPIGHYLLKRYQHGNAYFGQMPFFFEASAKDFFLIYLKAAGCLVLGTVAFLFLFPVLGAIQHAAQGGPSAKAFGMLYGLLATYVFYMFFIAYFEGKTQNLVWNHTTFAGMRFESRVKVRKLMAIRASNLILIGLTLGLYKPFADVRLVKYRVEAMSLIPLAGGLESILADHSNDRVGAVGEEAGDLFDIDIAL